MLIVQQRSDGLGRLIKTGSASRDRIWLERGIVIAIRNLSQQSDMDETTYDLVAFIALSLKAIGDTVEESVAAWEKRGYWVKADRYRMEWNWANKLGEDLQQAVLQADWGNVVKITTLITQRMSKTNVPTRNRLGTPWIGSWDRLMRESQSE
jgi:hypothetical protein